jgi:hypothetical protein
LLNGFARVIFETGDYYKGEWKNHKRHGYGKYVFLNGLIKKGKWKNDKYTNE